jgi:hypothetical protein
MMNNNTHPESFTIEDIEWSYYFDNKNRFNVFNTSLLTAHQESWKLSHGFQVIPGAFVRLKSHYVDAVIRNSYIYHGHRRQIPEVFLKYRLPILKQILRDKKKILAHREAMINVDYIDLLTDLQEDLQALEWREDKFDDFCIQYGKPRLSLDEVRSWSLDEYEEKMNEH